MSKQLAAMSAELDTLKQSSGAERKSAVKASKALQTRVSELEAELEEATEARGRGGEVRAQFCETRWRD